MFLIADNIQITRKAVYQAFLERDPKPIADIAARCAAAGAKALDLNIGPAPRDPEGVVEFFVSAALAGADLPFCMDTVNPRAMDRGLSLAKRTGRPMVNGVSLAPEKLFTMAELAIKHDADLVAYLLTAEGAVCPNADTRLSVAAELWTRLLDLGVPADRIIVDPVCVPLLWADGLFQAGEVTKTVRLLPEVLGFAVRTIVGLSNLTMGRASIEKKRLFSATYLAMLGEAGLTHALVNAEHKEVLSIADAVGIFKSGCVFSWE